MSTVVVESRVIRETRASLVVRGAAALVFGVLTLIWPGITLLALVLLWGAYVLVDGIFTLIAEVRRPAGTRRIWASLGGLVSIAAGVVTFVWPGITTLALLWVIAIWLAITGATELAMAFGIARRTAQRPLWLLAVIGLLSIAAAVVLVVAPGTGALAITWAIGWWAIANAVLFFIWAAQTPSLGRAGSRAHRSAHRTTFA
jgi:uncharacterized membrane protein HdeD (DUF308 family)